MTQPQNEIPSLEVLRTKRDEIISVAEEHGAFNVRVFGSVAKGSATTDSDVDILVSTRPGVSIFDLVGLWLDLQELLGVEVSLVTDEVDPRRADFIQRVNQDAVPL